MTYLLRVAAAAALTAAAILPAAACPDCESAYKPGTYTGEARRVGNGLAYTWVTLDAKGKPSALGVNLTEGALTGLPETVEGPMPGVEYELALPRQASKSGFDHAVLNWNPKGHIPPGIYDTPHFDVHFYTMSSADRMKITAKGADLVRCRKAPAAGMMPAGYIYAPGGEEPEMGAHWVDTASPEFNGKPFTTTFLYGSYNGQVIFIEPMLTLAYLQTKPQDSEAIKLPKRYAKDTYFPTHYAVRHDPVRGEYAIALEGLTWRTAPAAKKPAQAAAKGKKTSRVAER